MKERKKNAKKNEPSLASMHQMVLEISHPKVRNLSKMDVAILFSASFYVNMTSQTQSGKTMKKMKVQYLRSLLFNLFQILQAARP